MGTARHHRAFDLCGRLLPAGRAARSLLDAGARVFHFDIGDGHFIPQITIGPVVLRSIAGLVHERGGVLDCHLMVEHPERHFESVREAGGDSVTFHVEVADDVQRVAAQARKLGLGVGIAFNPETEVERAAAAADGMDTGPLHEHQPRPVGTDVHARRIRSDREARSLLPETVFVQVDGGVSAENAVGLRDAGADLARRGSAIFWQNDPAAAYLALTGQVEAFA